MAMITFYRQARYDGGVRTGIEIDQNTVLSRFDRGRKESDPALLWYIDVRCSVPRLPRNPEAARRWLLGHEDAITDLLLEIAGDVPVGYDPGDWPIQRSRVLPDKARITIAFSAVRRLEARHMAETLRELATAWRQSVQDLSALPAA